MLSSSAVAYAYPAISLPSLPTQDDLPSEDGIPMETERHRVQMELLINPLRSHLARLGEGYVSGDMFVYVIQPIRR